MTKQKLIPITYFNNHKLFFCIKKYNIKDFRIIYNLIEELDDLEVWQKNLILTRFLHIYKYIKNYYIYICRCYSLSKLFIIVVGIINPALLSINHDQNNDHYVLIYWSVWILQLVVSILTALISFFKWDKKYFLYTSYKTKIEQEIWLYLELTGKYAVIDFTNKEEFMENRTSHSTKLKCFLTKIEALYKKLKDSDLEIEDIDEDNKDDGSSTNNGGSQLIKRDIEKDDIDKNNSSSNTDYQNYILSQLKILLNDIKAYILEYTTLSNEYNSINNLLTTQKKNSINLKKQVNNEKELEENNKKIQELSNELSKIKQNIDNVDLMIKNKINSEYNKIKANYYSEEALLCEVEQFFNENNISIEPYMGLFKN